MQVRQSWIMPISSDRGKRLFRIATVVNTKVIVLRRVS